MNDTGPLVHCDPLRLIQSLMHSGKATEAQLDVALTAVGLSAVKWNALQRLVEAGGGLPLSQLAEQLSCVKSNVTQLMDRLAAENLVRRTPDPEDRRIIRAELTSAGRQRFAEGMAVMREFERRLLADYTREEQILLAKLLSRLGTGGPDSA